MELSLFVFGVLITRTSRSQCKCRNRGAEEFNFLIFLSMSPWQKEMQVGLERKSLREFSVCVKKNAQLQTPDLTQIIDKSIEITKPVNKTIAVTVKAIFAGKRIVAGF